MDGQGEAGRRPTIYDVAARAGVSKSLVSLVLRGGTGVSPARRAAIADAIAALEYRPSRAATALAARRSHTVGVVIDDYRNLWFVALLDGLREVLDPQGIQLTVSDQHRSGPSDDPIDRFVALHVDGLVIATEPSEVHLAPGVPTVVVGDRASRSATADRVADDGAVGAGLAVQHLHGLGHRRIAHLTGAGGSAAARRLGYERAMRRLGLVPLVRGHGLPTNEEGGFLAADGLLREHPDITAVFATNDTVAAGAFGAMRARGLSVPGDLSLVGYDDSPVAQPRFLDLTTVDAHVAEVGRRGARMLLERMGGAITGRSGLAVAPTLVIRSSSRAVPDL